MSVSRHRNWQCIAPAGMVLAALVIYGSGTAQAAPQALALVATNGKVVLTCGARECSAEVTSFCLDAGRFSPSRGTPYRVAGGGHIQLTGTAEDGSTLTLDARTHLRFAAARRHLAVRVSIDRATLEARGIRQAEIDIAENVALLPAPQPGDPNPITKGEAALFTGPLRHLGTLVVDANAERMQAARITSRLINLLPPGEGGGTDGEALWQRATAAQGANGPPPAARTRARGAFELCRFVGSIGGPSGLRRCLQEQHDGFVDFLNSKFWEAVKTGT